MAEPAKSLKVFVSYSRADVSFADQLVLALEDKGFEAILDRHDISGAENWRERLGKLILSADAVAFVLTAKSAASEICSWEVDAAVRLGKRIIPVTPGSIDGVTPPAALSELNWIPFYPDPAIPGAGFYYGVKRLVEALSIDLDWLRAQTRYSERALEWTKEKPEDLLLRGEALKEAEAWQARTPAGSHPPDLVREYLAASGDAEQHRQVAAKAQLAEREQALKTAEAAVADSKQAQRALRRFSIWALVAGVLLLAIAIPGNYFAAVRTLDANDRRATLFADAANALSQKGEYSRALLMALAGDPPARAGLFESLMRPDGNMSVRNALARAYASDRAVASMDVEDAVGLASLPDGKRFFTVHTSGKVMLWAAGETLEPQTLALPKPVANVFPLPDNDSVIVEWQLSDSQPFAVWSLTQAKVLREFGPVMTPERKEWPQATTLSNDGAWLVMGAEGGNISVWDTATGAEVKSTQFDVSYNTIGAIAADSRADTVVVSAGEKVMIWNPIASKRIGPVDGSFGQVRALAYYFLETPMVGPSEEGTVLFGSAGGNVGSVEDDGKLTPALQTFAENLGETEDVVRLRPSRDGRGMLLVSDGGQVRLLDLASNKVAEPFGQRTDIVDAGYLSQAGMLAAVSRDGTVLLAAYGRSAERTSLQSAFGVPETTPQASVVTYAAQDGTLILVNPDKSMRAWRLGMPASLRFTMPEDVLQRVQATSFLFSEKSSLFATTDGEKVEIWSPDTPVPKAVLQPGAQGDAVVDGRLVADGQALYYLLASGTAGVRRIDPQEDVFPPRKFDIGVTRFLYPSPDGRRIVEVAIDAVAESAGTTKASHDVVRVYEAGAEKPSELKVGASIARVAFSPDGKILALMEARGMLELWHPGEARSFQRLTAHRGAVTSLVFAPGGDLFATTGDDLRIVIWRLGDRDPVQVFEVPIFAAGDAVIDFSPDGKSLLAVTPAGVLHFGISPALHADVDTQVKLACDRLDQRGVQGFSDADYNQFSFIGKFDDRRQRNPCVKLGVTPMKPAASPAVAAVAKPKAGN